MNPNVEKLLKLPAYQRLIILLGVLALIVGLLVYLFYLPLQEEYGRLKAQNATLQVKVQEDTRIASNLPAFKAEYQKMEQQLESALSELPNDREIPTLLTSIASMAKDNGLEVLRFKPGKEVPKGFYAEVPVELKLVGSFHQVAMFYQAVSNLSRIVNIGNLNIAVSSGKSNENLLSVECLATTFRFLEDSTATGGKTPVKGAQR
ncbi:type IV pilus assembly protein PilO [Desulfuromonas soudanensis]|uniref:Type IV pilus assembly protein PilO n=1 Tax=Desulfuromonas soudanensis TaxID=1603606 RepID=A0A0M4D398_9BACT|nr:type 4a pilus biogenesis protein PilO [Desulfuromonas soudanensis]ALC16914.1 type IV pilus assembly protein PilO [Desulfuromonas soudanensis]